MKTLLILDSKKISAFYLMICLATHAHAADSYPKTQNTATLEEVVVSSVSENASSVGIASLAAVEGTKIYSGKKTQTIDIDQAPTIVNSNFRQVLEKTPGLLLSEESTPLFSVGYRGLEPHRAQFTQVLKDGIPIHADMFGYPEAYYVPPTKVIDHIDFIRGGGSLMYGPQPGGALNFVTQDPYTNKPFTLIEENAISSHDGFSNYTALTGTEGAFAYYAYYHHRQSQGFRQFNSQYDLNYGGSKFVITHDPTAKTTITFDVYSENHGEPGGLTRAMFDTQPDFSSRMNDRFELNRYSLTAAYDKEVSETDTLSAKAWGIYYERLSWRQRGGGFGTLPTGATAASNDIESQEFYTAGLETRYAHEYEAFGSDDHVLSGGVFYQHTTSPRIDKRGATSDDVDGVVRKDADRSVNNVALFLENLFRFGKFSITPGVRLENIWQDIKENINLDKTTVPLADEGDYNFVALAGVGSEYEVTQNASLYANFSQSYRPQIYTQAVPNGTNQVVNSDLKEGRSWQADAGIKGNAGAFLSWDASYFYMEFDDQIGSATIGGLSTVQNVGDARHQGVELATELNITKWWDTTSQQNTAQTIGEFSLFYNAMFLDAEFVGGPNTGKTPQYAPDFIQKSGVEYNWQDRFKARFGGTFTDDHFADDNNTTTRIVPSYKVWDLMLEAKVYKDVVTVFGGINNIFDESYFARVRADGIDPADGRNYYAGAKVVW